MIILLLHTTWRLEGIVNKAEMSFWKVKVTNLGKKYTHLMYKATHCVWLRTIVEYWLVKDINDTWHQGLQEKSCKAKPDCFRAPGTDWDFSQNWEFEVQ